MIAVPATANAHAAYQSSIPEPRARLDAAPESVTVNYAEPPTTDSVFSVIDGCGRDVAGDVEILNRTIEASIDDAQPGLWTVEWTVLSAVDGHATRDQFRFTVDGEADCTAAAPDDGAADGEPAPDASGGSLVQYLIGAVVLVALAAGVRMVAGREKG
ncbi:MAG: copper resistance protein CopC [Actinomycetota bacterium]|nr:copper resistance protein CopC [Actinomycetota bacterium]